MKIDITDETLTRLEQDGAEGSLVDPAKVEGEGLFEELRLFVTSGVYGDPTGYQTSEFRFESLEGPKTFLTELARALDLGINVEPGETTRLTLHLAYRYDYGAAS